LGVVRGLSTKNHGLTKGNGLMACRPACQMRSKIKAFRPQQCKGGGGGGRGGAKQRQRVGGRKRGQPRDRGDIIEKKQHVILDRTAYTFVVETPAGKRRYSKQVKKDQKRTLHHGGEEETESNAPSKKTTPVGEEGLTEKEKK